MKVTVFDMFCGGGGSSRGAVMAGAVPVAGLDKWNLATETYQLNFPKATVYRMKASSLSPQRVKDDVGPINLLLASPECTSHSIAKGNAPRCEKSRATAFEVIRFAKVLEPRWIVVENVEHMQKWAKFESWHRKLIRLGYQTTTAVVDSKDHSTPQSRRRLFILCDREAAPKLPRPMRGRRRTVASILGTGEPMNETWSFKPVRVRSRATATIQRANRAIKNLGSDTPFIMVYYGTDGAGGFQTLDRPLRTVTTLDRFAYVRRNCRGHEMRMLQPTELSAAMGFPENHLWPETSRRNRIHLIGNAVCPPVMCDIVRTLTGLSKAGNSEPICC